MAKRVAFGLLAVSLIVSIVGGDALIARWPPGGNALLAAGSLIPVVLVFLSVAACRELAAMCLKRQLAPYVWWATLSCAVLVLAPWFSAAGMFGRSAAALEAVTLQLIITALACLGAGCVAVVRQDVDNGLANIAATWLLIGFAGLLPSFLTLIRCDVNRAGEHGAWILLTVILVCKLSDIGAYFVGSMLGKHRLCPAVSPAKSVEGLAGGILASCAISVLFLVAHRATLPTENTDPNPNVGQLVNLATMMYAPLGYAQAVIFGALMAIVGHFGDLAESVFKRSAGVKDSGALLPRFGGVLDMIDSPIAIAPVAWVLLTRVWGV